MRYTHFKHFKLVKMCDINMHFEMDVDMMFTANK